MNNQVRPTDPRHGQLLLLDYKFTVADVDGQGEKDDDLPANMAVRHLGKLNIATTDGSVRSVWPFEIDEENQLWKPWN